MSNNFRIVRNRLLGQSLDDWSPKDKWVRNVGLLLTILIAVPSFQKQDGFGSLIVLGGGIILAILLFRTNDAYARLYEETDLRLQGRAKHRKAVKRPTATRSTETEEETAFEPPFTQRVIEVKDEFGENQRIPVLSLLDPETPMDFVYVRVWGGQFVGGSNEAQVAAVRELGGIADKTLLLTTLTAGIGPLYIRAPHDIHEDYAYYGHQGNPFITRPDMFKITDPRVARRYERLRRSSDQEASMVRAYGMVDDWSLFVIAIRRDDTTANLFGGGKVDEDEVYDLPVLQLARGFVERLRSSTLLGYEKVEIVLEHDLCMLVRQAWDTVGIHEFYKTVAPIRAKFDQGLMSKEKFADILWDEIGCLPQHITSPRQDYMVADGNYISVLRMMELPEYVFPSVEKDLLQQGTRDVWLRRSSLGIGSSAKVERGRVYSKKASNANFVSALFSGFTIKPDFVEEQRETLDEESAQLRNIPLVQRYEIYYALVAATPARLAHARSELISTLKGVRYEPEVVELEAIHREKLFAATLGIHP